MKSRTFLTALLVAGVLAVALVGVAWASSSGGAARKATAPRDALTAARFSITIDGYEIASFTELARISSGIDAVEVDGSAQLIPPRHAAAVVLSRGLGTSLELDAWHEAVLRGDGNARKSCSIVMYDTDGKPVARYYLEHAWPSKLELGSLKAGSSEVLVQTVTFVSERIQRVAP